jgi:tRNA (Thr-GGU) A37 N-methylase
VVGGHVDAVDNRWDAVAATIELDPDGLEAGATDGLADFSHIEVVFCFDRVDESSVCRGTRRPRGRADWPSMGILA